MAELISKLAFEPINEDHAVQVVEFSLTLNRQVTEDDVRNIVRTHRSVVDDVPAVGGLASGDVGIELSYRRPNGTSIWAVSLFDDVIQVECSRYTRWDKVWTTARRLIAFTANACVMTVAETKFGRPRLAVTDKFLPVTSDAQLQELFQPGPLLPESLFSRGRAWHCNQGWFEMLERDDRILHQLNLAGKGELHFELGAMEPKQRFVVSVEHVQEYRSQYASWSDDDTEWLDAQMKGMHINNKEVLRNLVSAPVQEVIRLWS